MKAADVRAELADAYDEYTANVSPDNMAVSLIAATYLLSVCRDKKLVDVADFGSGFTSYVLAHYARTADYPVTVTSIDTDPEWLARTDEFLTAHELQSRLVLWDDYLTEEQAHDLICYDLGGGDVREAGMPVVLDRISPNGVVLFDDAQHIGHADAMRAACRARRRDLYSLRDETLDDYGRFMAVSVRPPGTIAELYAQACYVPSDIVEHLPYFYDLVTTMGAKKVIELGTRGGVSTIAWLYALDQTDGHLWSVDIDPAPELPTDRWTFLQGDDIDPHIVRQLPQDADIVFIDTSHMYAQTLSELNVYRWCVRSGGKIVLHDTEVAQPGGWTRAQPRYPVQTAVREFCADENLTVEYRTNCFGLAIIEMP